MNELKIKGIYKHFKGDYYIVEDIAIHSETKEEYIIYVKSTLRGAFLIPKPRTISSVVEHSPHKRNVVGSIPAWSIKI